MDPYLNLIRFHAPVGTLLLMWPPLWTLALLSPHFPQASLLVAFALGAFFMRSGGCIINDLTDKSLDASVARTKARPLASGEITPKQALILLAILIFAASAIAFWLGTRVFIAALVAIPLIIAYPWMKRIIFWPQLFLGITFNYGIILASLALFGYVHAAAVQLYLGAILWTLGYDTIYGYQDIEDDIQLGIKSTARLFGDKPKPILSVIYAGTIICWALAGYLLQQHVSYYLLLALVAMHFTWQIKTLDIKHPESCKRMFNANAWLGGVIFGVLLMIKMASQ